MQLNKKSWIAIPVVGIILIVGYVVFFFSQSKPDEEKTEGNNASQVIEVKGEGEPKENAKKEKRNENSEMESQEDTSVKYSATQATGVQQKIAEDFISAYFQFNGDNPNENIEKATKFTTTDLANGIRGQSQVVRSTSDMYKLKLTRLSTSEGDPWSSNDLWFIVVANGQFYSEQGAITDTIETTYQVFLQQNDSGNWQVSDFAIVRK
ncbi:hypothetical protein [Carnobacterium maltaromaticum]|uniref:hypothetical protein n=1 Tax=Carnobacterium maltaromaticum TaxID=2751 RepID=UPI00295EB297|nr:hypothetical protein [Carnobacterium maltaromaticum]